jgi:hypothetical protein
MELHLRLRMAQVDEGWLDFARDLHSVVFTLLRKGVMNISKRREIYNSAYVPIYDTQFCSLLLVIAHKS